MIFNMGTDVHAYDCTFVRGGGRVGEGGGWWRVEEEDWGGGGMHVRESALKVDSGRKIPCGTGELNLPQWYAGPALCQLSYIPTPAV